MGQPSRGQPAGQFENTTLATDKGRQLRPLSARCGSPERQHQAQFDSNPAPAPTQEEQFVASRAASRTGPKKYKDTTGHAVRHRDREKRGS